MSGVPMPEMLLTRPRSLGTGGKFDGILKMTQGTPAASKTCQKATPLRRFSAVPPASGST